MAVNIGNYVQKSEILFLYLADRACSCTGAVPHTTAVRPC